MLWIAILTGAGLAATWTVEQDGSGDYEDIATAIAAAASGDSILVGPGFYEGVVDFGGKDLQVVSTDGPELTTIDGDGAGVYAVVFDSGESAAALLEGFTIDNTTRYAAIKVDASDPVLSDLVIRGFRAQGTSAVWVEDAGPTLTGIVFDDNESDDDGGHLHIERPLSMLIEDSSFTGGVADGYGGGFYVYGDCAAANDLTVTGSSFEDNTGNRSHFYAACISLHTESCTFRGAASPSMFTNWKTQSYTDLDSLWEDNPGQALYLSNHSGTHTLDGTIFRGNGGASASPTLETGGHSGGSVVFDGVTFEDNATTPGALELDHGGSATITDCSFTNNTASAGPGAILSSDTVSISGSSFTGNRGTDGGAVEILGLSISSSTFTGNVASGDGGAVYMYWGHSANISDTVFEGNVAGDTGGAVYTVDSGFASTIRGCSFIDNSADDYGAVYQSHSSVTIEDTLFDGNDDGALYARGMLDLSGLEFTGNHSGWAAMAYGDASSTIEENLFLNNRSGGLCVSANNLGSPIVVTGNHFEDTSGNSALEIPSGEFLIQHNTFLSNSVSGDGGAVYLDTASDVEFSSNLVCDNSASSRGGAMYVEAVMNGSTYPDTFIRGNIFVGNQATQGADLYYDGDQRYRVCGLELYNNTLVNSYATDSAGGAVYIQDPDNAEVVNNIFAYGRGGGALSGDSVGAATTVVWFNDFYDNVGGDGTGSFDPTFVGVDDNIGSQPLFSSYTGACDDEYWLDPASPLIDEGDPTISDLDGSRSDIGAYGGGDPFASDLDGDGVWDDEDCDDGDATAYPGAPELCDWIDNDCDGSVDEDAVDTLTWYLDGDGDGHGGDGGTTESCAQPSGYAEDMDDCDDGDATAYPGADETCDGVDNDCDEVVDEDEAIDATTWCSDGDGDGFGDATDALVQCAQPSGYVGDCSDCMPNDPDIHPGADEYCDGIDNNCDYVIDEGDAVDASTWYYDGDSDGYGCDTYTQTACERPNYYRDNDEDCDDSDGSIHPGAEEQCNGVDDDCDGDVDEGCDGGDDTAAPVDKPDPEPEDSGCRGGGGAGQALLFPLLLLGWRRRSALLEPRPRSPRGGVGGLLPLLLLLLVACGEPDPDKPGDDTDAPPDDTGSAMDDADGDGVPADEDCDDEDPDVGSVLTWYADLDGDAWGDAEAPVAGGCTAPAGAVGEVGDCDDSDPAINPGAQEVCNGGVDDDCDGLADEADGDLDPAELSTWYLDNDGDSYGDPDSAVETCEAPSGFVVGGGDCDDDDAAVNPAAEEICNDGVDNDCDGGAEGCGFEGEMTLGGAQTVATFEQTSDGALGSNISLPGDLNGDGQADLVLGDNSRTWSASYSGAAFVFYGPLSGDYEDRDADAILPGGPESWWFWSDPHAEHDLNGDGYADLSGAGYYATTGTSHQHEDGGAVAVIFGPIVDGTRADEADFIIEGSYEDQMVGIGLEQADFDGDGAVDVLVGSGGDDLAALFLGPIDAEQSTMGARSMSFDDAYSIGELATDDFDGDGLGDFVFGGPYAPVGSTDSGVVYVAYGGSVADRDLSADYDVAVTGASSYDTLGYRVAAGDLDGDGRGDLVASAPGADTSATDGGCVYVFEAPLSSRPTPSSASARICGDSYGVALGGAVDVAPDLDGDGRAELVLGSYRDSTAGGGNGAAWLFFGAVGGTGTVSSADATLLGASSGERAGWAMKGVSDLDGDGSNDLLVTASNGSSSVMWGHMVYLVAGGGM